MKVLITGRNGQLGFELQRTVPREWQIIALPSDRLDIRCEADVLTIAEKYAPGLIINAAAYTAVDRAEKESEQAFAVNADGAANLARAAAAVNCRLIHISTDFIFNGTKSCPYLPADQPDPISIYGASKLAGELKVAEILGEKSLIIRTAWVYSRHGHNFVKTMLRLMRERDNLSIVADQIGTPTWARGLAETVWKFANLAGTRGVYHWTDAGVASWYDFAVAIQEEACRINLLDKEIPVYPIRTEDYPTPARRPSYGVLDKTATWLTLGGPSPHWRQNLRRMLGELTRDEV